MFKYQGKGRNLEPTEYRSLSNSLIPPRLCITDNCQHFNVLKKRLRGEGIDTVMVIESLDFGKRLQVYEKILNFYFPGEVDFLQFHFNGILGMVYS